ncbi:MAG: DNA-3-methyladenine glycosylase 2 family protein [Henriciella sp.]
MTRPTEATLTEACDHLAGCDAAFARAYDVLGLPDWRYGAPDYAVIARMIAFQQITTKAAATIWGRVEEAIGDVCTAGILSAEEETLRGCGLSRPKIRHLRSIAEAVETGALDLGRVHAAEMDAARKELIAVKGIGPWTADLFLLYCGRLDAWPSGDVGLMEAYKMLHALETRHDTKAFDRLAETWRPYRGVAAHLLWNWINAERAKAYAADGGG